MDIEKFNIELEEWLKGLENDSVDLEYIKESIEAFGPEELRELGFDAVEIAENPYVVSFETRHGGYANLGFQRLDMDSLEQSKEQILEYLRHEIQAKV